MRILVLIALLCAGTAWGQAVQLHQAQKNVAKTQDVHPLQLSKPKEAKKAKVRQHPRHPKARRTRKRHVRRLMPCVPQESKPQAVQPLQLSKPQGPGAPQGPSAVETKSPDVQPAELPRTQEASPAEAEKEDAPQQEVSKLPEEKQGPQTHEANGAVFQHPGVLLSRAQLDFVKQAVKNKLDPMYIAYEQAAASKWGKLDYEVKGPPANGTIECGSYDKPDVGCSKQHDDAMAAYVQSVLWYVSGDQRYADNAIKILNAYARGLKQYTNSNAPLDAAWGAELWPRAAEILRYSNAGWKVEDIAAFGGFLTGVVLPRIEAGSAANGNWELSMVDAMMGIAVFTDDRALFYYAEAMWKERVPTYIYLAELDGARPKPVPRGAKWTYWYGANSKPSTIDLDKSVDGMTQETCRDLGHTSMGLAAMIDAAETAHIQGDELYESEQKRLVAAMEFDSHLLLKKEPVPAMVCGGKLNYSKTDTFVIGYNEFHNRLGVEMPQTREWLEQHVENDPAPLKMFMIVFEPLTHGADAKGKE